MAPSAFQTNHFDRRNSSSLLAHIINDDSWWTRGVLYCSGVSSFRKTCKASKTRLSSKYSKYFCSKSTNFISCKRQRRNHCQWPEGMRGSNCGYLQQCWNAFVRSSSEVLEDNGPLWPSHRPSHTVEASWPMDAPKCNRIPQSNDQLISCWWSRNRCEKGARTENDNKLRSRSCVGRRRHVPSYDHMASESIKYKP